jgi:hypothetical protein
MCLIKGAFVGEKEFWRIYSQGINKMIVFEKTNNTYAQPD